MTDHDIEVDLAVVGSGGGGLVDALSAAHCGLNVIVLEKSEYYGGTTGYSAGGVWVPQNPLQAAAGVVDSAEDAELYWQATVGDDVSAARKAAYLSRGPELIQFLLHHTPA